jgi:hypothetical protein
MTNDEANWKIFRRDTEAGRLLSRLYGVSNSQQKLNYPKQRRRRRVNISETSDDEDVEKNSPTTSSRPWRTTYSCQGWSKAAEEERERERKNNIARALSLSVPKVGRGKQHSSRHSMINGNNHGLMIHVAKVDQIPRRRTEVRCRHDQEHAEFVNKKYRPPCSYATSSDEEKQRLNIAFETNGGKCLPNLPAPAAASPSLMKNDTSRPPANTLFDQIVQEIVERRQYQMDLEAVGAGDATRDQIADQIRVRVEHLKKIDPMRATMVVKQMMKSS